MYGIQGEPNSGKTTAALSFPNPIVLDLDRKLPAQTLSIPFWSPEWVNNYLSGARSLAPNTYPNRKYAIQKWLKDEGHKLENEYTIILDSWTNLQNFFDDYAEEYPQEYFSKENNAFDGRKFYADKIAYSYKIISLLKGLRCRVVVTFHEQAGRNSKGELIGKYKPLMDGSFKDQLLGHFGYHFRQINPRQGTYLWQVCTDHLFSAMIGPEYKFDEEIQKTKVIPANWDELQKHRV